MLSFARVLKIDVRVTSLVYKCKTRKNKIKYVYVCTTRSERVCDKGSIKREWLFIIYVTFSLSNSPDIRLLCLIICYLCFWFVFKFYYPPYIVFCIFILFRSVLQYVCTIYMYIYIFLCVWICILMGILPMYKEINCKLYYLNLLVINMQ